MTCPATDRDELMTVTEAASRYKLAPKTIYKWINCGALPFVLVGPTKEVRVRPRDLATEVDARVF